ncbi:unnamed protein product, partial [marine sediment metagenome]
MQRNIETLIINFIVDRLNFFLPFIILNLIFDEK